MRYKIGDSVLIREWYDMVETFKQIQHKDMTNLELPFGPSMEADINKKFPNRILTIKNIKNNFYHMEKINWNFCDYMIKGLAKKPTPIHTRWEILDL